MENIDCMIERIRQDALWWRKEFGRSLGVTSELGEYYACKELKLKRAQPGEKGFDATKGGKTYQIKSRAPRKGVRVNWSGRVGKFSGFDFDYGLLVLLDHEYKLEEIYQADAKTLERLAQKEETGRRGIHISAFIKNSKKIWPICMHGD